MLSHKHTNRQRVGFTLVELMISVVIMVLMMLAFGMIVSEAQKVVNTSENVIRGNMTADAIARVIKNDFSQLTKTGFLCITTREGAANHTPVLLFTTAGIKYSKINNLSGNCGISVYGYAGNTASSIALFLRQGWILNSSVGATTGDVWKEDMSNIQGYTRYEISRLVDSFRNLQNCTFPPETFTQAQELWSVLTIESNGLSILWTDGNKDSFNNIKWYGIDYNGTDGYWFSSKLDYVTVVEKIEDEADINNPTNIEFNSYKESPSASGGYEALWTHHDTTNWPKAIKIRFRLRDKELGDKHTASDSTGGYTDYEVICNIK